MSNMGKHNSLITKTKQNKKIPPNLGNSSRDFNVKGVSLRPVLAPESGRCTCLIATPTWGVLLPIKAVICLVLLILLAY